MGWLVEMLAIVFVFGSPAYIVKQFLDYRERKHRHQLEAGSGGTSRGEVKKLEEENKLLKERVENLESIVVGVDFELNQKIAKLVSTNSFALPAKEVTPAPAPP